MNEEGSNEAERLLLDRILTHGDPRSNTHDQKFQCDWCKNIFEISFRDESRSRRHRLDICKSCQENPHCKHWDGVT